MADGSVVNFGKAKRTKARNKATKKKKPEVMIGASRIVPILGGAKILVGVPIDHPRADLNGHIVDTSAIMEIREGGRVVETINTIYRRIGPLLDR